MLTVLVVEYNGTLLQEDSSIEQVQAWNKNIIESINLAVRSTENQQIELISRNEKSAKWWSKSERSKTLNLTSTFGFNDSTTMIEKVESLMDKIERDQILLQDHIKEVCLRDRIVKGLNVNDMESRMIIDQKRHFAYCGIGKVLNIYLYDVQSLKSNLSLKSCMEEK